MVDSSKKVKKCTNFYIELCFLVSVRFRYTSLPSFLFEPKKNISKMELRVLSSPTMRQCQKAQLVLISLDIKPHFLQDFMFNYFINLNRRRFI